jgi:hypothetical protein
MEFYRMKGDPKSQDWQFRVFPLDVSSQIFPSDKNLKIMLLSISTRTDTQ